MSVKVFTSFWEQLFQILFSGGYLTIKNGWWIVLIAFGISSVTLLLQTKVLEIKKLFYMIVVNFAILAISMFIPALMGGYIGFVLVNGLYSIKAQRSLPLFNKILIGILNCVGILGLLGMCGIFIFFWRYIYSYMVAGGIVVGILLYLITPIRAFFFSLSENLSSPRMKKIGLATVITFVVLGSMFGSIGFIRPYIPAPESYTPSGAMDITIVTYNIRQGTGREKNEYDFWKYRKDNIATYIDSFDADFICVQEAFYFQISYLTKVLINRTYKFVGAGRDDGVIGGEHAGILFDSEKFHLITGGNFWLSDYPYFPSHPWKSIHQANRVISWARFEEIATQEQVFVCSVHYDSGEEFRQKANVMLNERIAEYSGDIPTIVAGDFNLNTSMSYWNLLENYGSKPLQSAYDRVHGPGPHYNTTFNGFDPAITDHDSFMIDFIFVSTGVLVMTCDVQYDSYTGPDTLQHYPSDHYPVIAHCII